MPDGAIPSGTGSGKIPAGQALESESLEETRDGQPNGSGGGGAATATTWLEPSRRRSTQCECWFDVPVGATNVSFERRAIALKGLAT